ncbi:MAG: hypothetical protein WAM24_12700 [Ignavibacteriaceae bacterium]
MQFKLTVLRQAQDKLIYAFGFLGILEVDDPTCAKASVGKPLKVSCSK